MTGILSREEKRLRIELEDIRKKYDHAGNKGGQVENIVRDFLSRYLPTHNRVGHGEVFNVEGLRSRQTDLVITNKYHAALTSDWNEAQTFIIEGVECAAEIKSTIKSVDTDLRDFFDKARIFKKMLIEPELGMQARMELEDASRFVWRKPFFGFAFESGRPHRRQRRRGRPLAIHPRRPGSSVTSSPPASGRPPAGCSGSSCIRPLTGRVWPMRHEGRDACLMT